MRKVVLLFPTCIVDGRRGASNRVFSYDDYLKMYFFILLLHESKTKTFFAASKTPADTAAIRGVFYGSSWSERSGASRGWRRRVGDLPQVGCRSESALFHFVPGHRSLAFYWDRGRCPRILRRQRYCSQLLLYRTRLYRNSHIPDREFQSRTETAHSMFCTVWLFGYTGFLIYRTRNLSPTQPVRYKSNWLYPK